MKQLILELSAKPMPTLDNFVSGKNTELLAHCQSLLNAVATDRLIYIWGESGSGKSHLLRAMVDAANVRKLNAVYVTGRHYTLPENLATADFVAIDDVQYLNAEAQIGLFHLYNQMRENHRTLLVSGPTAPSALALRDDLVTRLGWGLVFQLHGLSDQEKSTALFVYARQRGFGLSEEVINYLLNHAQRDMPSLLATLEALDRSSLAEKRAVTVPLLREILKLKEESK